MPGSGTYLQIAYGFVLGLVLLAVHLYLLSRTSLQFFLFHFPFFITFFYFFFFFFFNNHENSNFLLPLPLFFAVSLLSLYQGFTFSHCFSCYLPLHLYLLYITYINIHYVDNISLYLLYKFNIFK